MAQFRTKARAVDLLGKGQIADLPTAISELWKNGYDAYGDNLEAFLYMKGYQNAQEPIFVLSDDGKGMSREDILEKWFVLGTDSKSRSELDQKGDDTLGKEPRIKMGEKGIGRLAVAYLGPQMLMLTKKKNYPLEAVFFDWRILENYDLFLSDVNIPLKSIESVGHFQTTFQELKDEFLLNFPQPTMTGGDPWKDQQQTKHEIIADCKNLSVPQFIIDDVIVDLLSSPTKSHGTRFVIFKPDEQLIELRSFTKNDEVSDNRNDESGRHTITSLVGLFNKFNDNINSPNTSFWINENENGRYNILDFASFFEPKDFEIADHLIQGNFDDLGNFSGSVRIYNKTISHSFYPVTKLKTKKTSYGSFSIKVGYVAGVKQESILNDEQYRYIGDKLEMFGGLYIYRDNFRVLPYGRVDNDFLGFEERRGRTAGGAFFSKRRMFGCIEISRHNNPRLSDKSSREGFITNVASRDFRNDLIAFFKDLAKKYFGTDAEYDYKRDQQDELKKLAEAERQEQERDREARKNFVKKLTELPKELEQLENEYNELLNQLKMKSNESQIVYNEVQDLLSKIENCKVKIVDYKLTKPTRFKPTQLQTKNYYSYTKRYEILIKHFDDSGNVLNKVRDKLKVHELFKEFEAQNELYKNRISSQFAEFDSRLENIFRKVNTEFAIEKEKFLSDFSDKYKAIVPSDSDATQISRSMKLLENIFKDSQERIVNRVTPYFDHLERLSFEVNEDNLVGYYKTQFEEIKEEWNKTYELAQLGIAVEIIDHQFNTLYSQLADSIKSLKFQLQPNNEAEKRYKNLDTAFEHLQDNYKLLKPLYRSTGRIRKDITGVELKSYAEDFFKARLDENKIKLSITPAAEKWTIYSYESIFKPVLVNIINNAIYWLQSVDKKEIKIDVQEGRLVVMNSGEPIDDYMLEDIFKLFYSNRPKGRGIGLYLAKQSLSGIGFEIEATNDPKYNQLNGACFLIYKKDN